MLTRFKGPLIQWSVVFIAPWVGITWFTAGMHSSTSKAEASPYSSQQQWLIQEVSQKVRNKEFPRQIEHKGTLGNETFQIEYTLNSQLQHEAERLLQAYKPDYAAIVVIEPTTGKIRAMTSYERGNEIRENLALRGTFPAASIFKMVTASAAVDKHGADPSSIIQFNGGSHTLYRKNVMSTQVNRWTREVTLREAFARSLNTAFGRLAFEFLAPQDLEDYALRFGFNRQIQGDLLFDQGVTTVPNDKTFHFAEIASGFNRISQMSPIQGALMAATIANDGKMPKVHLIEKVTSGDSIVLSAKPEVDYEVVSAETATKMRDLMGETISSGTSRKSFRQLRRDRRFKEVEIGGKTGSLMGMNPRGKTDWFVGYAIGENGEKLAIAAVTVNVNLWRVKSSVLAQSVVRRHFREMADWVARNDND